MAPLVFSMDISTNITCGRVLGDKQLSIASSPEIVVHRMCSQGRLRRMLDNAANVSWSLSTMPNVTFPSPCWFMS